MNLVILIPIFNDWKSVSKLLEDINSNISNLDCKFSIIIVNYASTEESLINNSNLTVYKYPEAQHSFDVDIPGFKYEGIILATGRKFTNVGHKESRELSIKRTLKFLNSKLN